MTPMTPAGADNWIMRYFAIAPKNRATCYKGHPVHSTETGGPCFTEVFRQSTEGLKESAGQAQRA